MTHRHAQLLLAFVLLAYFGPPLLRGEVIFVHDNRIEMGLSPATDSSRISARKLSDQSSIFIPALHLQLRGDTEGWISTWNPHPELGRPAYHVSSFSKAFVLTHVFSWLTDDPFHIYTWLAISAAALTTFFGYGLLRCLRLHPAACTAGALWLGMGVTVVYWLTFVMLVWGVCWTLALLWGVTVFLQRPSWPGWIFIAFSVHALLLTGYPQHIVWQGYLVAGYVLFAIARDLDAKPRAGALLTGLFSAALVGLVSVAPVYLDLLLTTERSARFDADPAFFLATLPEISGLRDLAQYWMRLFDPFWLGNPIRDGYPLGFDGVCLSPLVATLAFLSLGRATARRVWPAQAFTGFALLMTLSPPLYLFGVNYLGLRVSRFDPFAATLIPVAVLAAYAADRAIRSDALPRASGWLLACAPVAMATVGAAYYGESLQPVMVAMGVCLFGGTLAFIYLRSPWLLVALSIIGTFHYGLPMQLVRRPDEIRLGSPLVDRVGSETRGRDRFALVGEGMKPILPPNQEVVFGLRSIHTYNSLSSNLYQDWVARISELGAVALGRHFRSISTSAGLAAPEFSFAGVGLLISAVALDPAEVGARVQSAGRGGIYRTRERPLHEAQIREFGTPGDGTASIAGNLRDAPRLPMSRALDRDDHLRFELSPAHEETLLFVSQQFHPQWRATAGETELETLLVNDFFQGVRVPAGTTQVALRFLPNARFSWLPQALFIIAGLAALVATVSERRNRGSHPA